MLDSDTRPQEILQSGFDLLGELIKFNIEAYKIIEDVLRTPAMVSYPSKVFLFFLLGFSYLYLLVPMLYQDLH